MGLIGIFKKMKTGTEQENYGRDIIISMISRYAKADNSEKLKVLDLGVGTGKDLEGIKNAVKEKKLELYGVECWEPYIKQAKERGINIFQVNIEKDKLPFKDAYFDIIIANQIIEHTKEIFWIFSEISRVLRKDGIAIIGIPNLAAFHNRMLLLLGKQPSSIEMLGPHIRGMTKDAFVRFITAGNYFEVTQVKGSGFYPFPVSVSRVLRRVFPTLSVGLFFVCKRTGKSGRFIEVLKNRRFQTNYFEGPD